MTDLGLYNFIKNELAKGRTKDDIVAQLVQSGNKPDVVEETYTAVSNGVAPVPVSLKQSSPIALAARTYGGERPQAITIACVLLTVVLVFVLVQLMLVSGLVAMILSTGGKTTLATLIALGRVGLLSIVLQLLLFAVIYGYWMMRRWGVYLYMTVFLLGLVLSAGSPMRLLNLGTLVAVIVIWIGFSHLEEMS